MIRWFRVTVEAHSPFNVATLTGVVFLAAGIVIAGFLIRAVVERNRFRSRAARTAGTIVGHEVAYTDGGSDGGPSPRYYSIAAFTTHNGTVARGRSRIASSPAAGRVGATAIVHYNPANPAEIDIDTNLTPVLNGCAFAGVIAIVAMTLVVGLALLAAGLL